MNHVCTIKIIAAKAVNTLDIAKNSLQTIYFHEKR
jgi:hypothetical protein